MTDTSNDNQGVDFLQWTLPKMGYRWDGFRKPRGQVLKRIRDRMQQLELSGGFNEYDSYLEEDPMEWKRLDKLCDVTISKFFRDRKLWDFIRDSVLRELVCEVKDATVSKSDSVPVLIWSAGCCNGEEPYSVAMIYKQLRMSAVETDLRPVIVLASDRNTEVLKRAQTGRYPTGALKELWVDEIETFFEKSVDDQQESKMDEPYKIKDKIREYIKFEQRDIRESMPEQTFDIVFCRNFVFTYFSKERQEKFLKRLKPNISEAGFLIVGSNEEIPEISWLEPVSDTHPVLVKVK